MDTRPSEPEPGSRRAGVQGRGRRHGHGKLTTYGPRRELGRLWSLERHYLSACAAGSQFVSFCRERRAGFAAQRGSGPSPEPRPGPSAEMGLQERFMSTRIERAHLFAPEWERPRSACRHDSLRALLNQADWKRATGIEPVLRAWKALVQPLHHARVRSPIIGCWISSRGGGGGRRPSRRRRTAVAGARSRRL
jgi:hypothetical protein